MNTKNNTPKAPLMQRVKDRTPEIILGAGVVVGAVGLYYFTKNIPTPSIMAGFAANAADPAVEVILGSDDAFFALGPVAAAELIEKGAVQIAETAGFRYILNAEAL